MKKTIVDVSNAKYVYDMHETLKEALELPDFYGKNMDALLDCLAGFIELPITIIVRGLSVLPNDLITQKNLLIKTFEIAMKLK